MDTVFISYSNSDKYFAELLELKLLENKIAVWRDQSAIRAGEEWRNSIDVGIKECSVLIFAMSHQSCSSHYVTYEWASAIGQEKPLIPVLLEDCERHPKIEPIHYLDFRRHTNATWQQLVDRIRETIKDAEQAEGIDEQQKPSDPKVTDKYDPKKVEDAAAKIQAYLNKRGFRMVSFDRIKSTIDESYQPDFLNQVIGETDNFAPAKLKGGKPGVKLL